MEWDRVVDARSDACGGQVLLEPLPVGEPHDIEMADGARPRRHMRKGDRHPGVGEELVVGARPFSALLVPLRQVTKLHAQHTGLYGVEPAVVPLEVVEVLSRLTMVAEHSAASR